MIFVAHRPQDRSHDLCFSQVGAQTTTQIEVTKSRDGSITVMVTGKAANVNEAKVRLQKDLQTNVSVSFKVSFYRTQSLYPLLH